MKKLILIPLVLSFCIVAYADGDVTFVDNNLATRVTLPDGTFAPVNQGYSVELFVQPDNGGAAPAPIGPSGTLGNWQSVAITKISPVPGAFAGPVVSLPGITDGGDAWLQIVGWSGNQPDFETALMQPTPELIGYSTVWSEVTGDPSAIPPLNPSPIVGFGEFAGLVLEPVPDAASTFSLSAMSATALLFFRWRKWVLSLPDQFVSEKAP